MYPETAGATLTAMKIRHRYRTAWLLAALAMLSMRALTPEGYMPASPGSGLVFELCPEGMPAAVMQALAGPGHHHRHHGADDTASQSAAAEQCPIGHMLSTAAAVDGDVAPATVPDSPEFLVAVFLPLVRTRRTAFRSRAPPC